MRVRRDYPPVKLVKEESDMRTQNKVKPDTILKTFWRNNERFADLFNTVLFRGNQILKPEEFNEIAEKHRKEKDVKTPSEFLSGLKKEDRLHPIISLCIYYGEDEWDGPLCLIDMLKIPDELKLMISDYKLNLIQVKNCGGLKFHNNDINIVFELVRLIYNQEYDKINDTYKDKAIDTELALVIGAVTNSQKIIDQAMRLEQEGEKMNMCKALEALEQRGFESGKKELLKEKIEKKLAKGKTIAIIADELEEEPEVIQQIISEIKESTVEE